MQVEKVCVFVQLHGNEANARHHTDNRINGEGEIRDIQIVVPENSSSFTVIIFKGLADKIHASVRAPTGEETEYIPERPETSFEVQFSESKTVVRISYYLVARGNTMIGVRFLGPIPGIWTISLKGEVIVEGGYHAWLPITGLVAEGVEFINSTPNFTVVLPSTTTGKITAGAYNNVTNALYDASSWGPTRILLNSPNLVAPGVNVTGIYPGNKQGTMTGTSVSSAILTGGCALMLQWGIVDGNYTEMSTDIIKPFLIRGCIREPQIKYPSRQWGYGKLNLLNTFNLLRP